jgi:hypothetical protein
MKNCTVQLMCPGCQSKLRVRVKAVYGPNDDQTPLRYEATVEDTTQG